MKPAIMLFPLALISMSNPTYAITAAECGAYAVSDGVPMEDRQAYIDDCMGIDPDSEISSPEESAGYNNEYTEDEYVEQEDYSEEPAYEQDSYEDVENEE